MRTPWVCILPASVTNPLNDLRQIIAGLWALISYLQSRLGELPLSGFFWGLNERTPYSKVPSLMCWYMEIPSSSLDCWVGANGLNNSAFLQCVLASTKKLTSFQHSATHSCVEAIIRSQGSNYNILEPLAYVCINNPACSHQGYFIRPLGMKEAG